MKNTTLKDLSVNHPYYCSDSNFYSNKAGASYLNWEDFLREWGEDLDLDFNHVFRFDVIEKEKKGTYRMEVFFILQRKGIFYPVSIDDIKEEEAKSIIEFLRPHFEKTKELWKPF